MGSTSTAYGKEYLPIDVLTACLDQFICFAILIYLQKHSLELDRVCYAWFGPKRKFRPRSGCVGSTSTAYGKEYIPIDVLTACLDQIIRFAILVYRQKHSLELDHVCYAWF